jgi:prepilin-type N-terminal cleavage/methylation domain-containing protein
MYRITARSGFTLVELLTVIGIISLLTSLLFPVFATARSKARELSCVSNLRQVGLAIKMYTQDYDEYYPWALDPTDRYTPDIWDGHPDFKAQIPFMPMLQETLQPYIKSNELFHCPADTGYKIEDFTGRFFDTTPCSYKRFGTSYVFRTEIAFRHGSEASIQDSTQLNVLMDSAGNWHGGLFTSTARYNVLHGDTHTKSLNRNQLDELWVTPL